MYGDGYARGDPALLPRCISSRQILNFTAGLQEFDVLDEVGDAIDAVAVERIPPELVLAFPYEMGIERLSPPARGARLDSTVLRIHLPDPFASDDPQSLVDDRRETLGDDPGRVEEETRPIAELDLGLDRVVSINAHG